MKKWHVLYNNMTSN